MLATGFGVVVLFTALAGFALLGLTAPRVVDVDDYLVARRTQGPGALGLSFLASGLGGWILFAVPEIGAFVGIDAVVGYAIGAAAPLLVLAAVGPLIRRTLPSGRSLGEVAHQRFGPGLHLVVSAVSVLYMFTFLTAELTAAGAVSALLAGLDARIVVVAVAGTTLVYTAVGGLRASLRTDRWQAWIIVALLAGALVAIVVALDDPVANIAASGLTGVDGVGLVAAATLVLAVTCANLFHLGSWQRVWASADDTALRRGAVLGAAASAPIILCAGLVGMAAVGAGVALGDPPVPFFAVLARTPALAAAVALFLAIALVASSVDTLESGLAAVLAPAFGQHLPRARLGTALLVLPAVALAWQGLSVLRLLLVADLLAAAIVVPALAVLWRRSSSAGAIAGCVGGLAGALLPGLVASGSVAERVGVVTFAGGVPTLAPFVCALVVSGVLTVAVSLRRPDAAGHRTPAELPGAQS